MHYPLLIGFIFLNIVASTQAMQSRISSQEKALRGLLFVSSVLKPDVVQDNQSVLNQVYNQPRQRHLYNQQDKKSFNKAHSYMQPKKRYAAEKRLVASRTDKKLKK